MRSGPRSRRQLNAFGSDSTASRYSGKVSQRHGTPAVMAARDMSSARSMLRRTRSISDAAAGASVNPQLPITAVVTPCDDTEAQTGSQKIWASRWVCPSMNPGATMHPLASISFRPRSSTSPTATIRSPDTATSAWRPSPPEPSTTRPPRITISITTVLLRGLSAPTRCRRVQPEP